MKENSNIHTRDKESKCFPPIAQIDLNYKKKVILNTSSHPYKTFSRILV
jgi:hypothetical protein